MSIPTNIEAHEVNTGGGCMVTIIQCPEWDYILATTEESVAVFKNEDAFWENEGGDELAIAWVKNYPVGEFKNTPNVPQKREYIETDKLSGEPFPIESRFITHRYYDNHKFFNEVLVALMPQGVVDMSSHDDEYPSVGLYIDNDKEIGIQMFIGDKNNPVGSWADVWTVSCNYYYCLDPKPNEDTLYSFDFKVDECVQMFNEILKRVTLRIKQDKEYEE